MMRRHLVSVWNPSYAVDAMDAHRAVLLDMVRQADAKAIEQDDVYVWWGKVRSPNRQAPMGHLDDVLALQDELAPDDEGAGETHLYLTDYRSLYVGQIAGIIRDDVTVSDPTHVPPYYAAQGLLCDCWFQLWDLRRLVHDDTLAVVHELKRLRNLRYHDRPVSLYGGMVELPLIVRRDDEARWFDPVERERFLGGSYWVEFDARSTGLAALERDLRDNLFGAAAWEALDPATRAFIATGERVFRDNRHDATFDFGPVIGSFAKALEKEVGLRLRAALRKVPEPARLANVDGSSEDLLTRRALTLGQFAHAMRAERALADGIRPVVNNGSWFTGQLPPIVEEFRKVRNDVVHDQPAERAAAVYWRGQLLGVGTKGVFTDLSEVRVR